MKIVEPSNIAKLPHRYQVLFAIFCVEQVIHLVKPEHLAVCRAAIDAAKGFMRGEVTAEECRVAADNAYATACAADAAYAAADAAYAARATDAASAAWAAAYAAAGAGAAYAAAFNKDKIVEQQWNYYYELLNLDKNIEGILVRE